VANLGEFVLMWKRESRVLTAGDLVVRKDSRIMLREDYGLEISELKAEDQGTYTCEVDIMGKPIHISHTVRNRSLYYRLLMVENKHLRLNLLLSAPLNVQRNPCALGFSSSFGNLNVISRHNVLLAVHTARWKNLGQVKHTCSTPAINGFFRTGCRCCRHQPAVCGLAEFVCGLIRQRSTALHNTMAAPKVGRPH
jgi:hypothetical protein